MDRAGDAIPAQAMQQPGIIDSLDYLVHSQSVMLATNQLLMLLATVLGVAALSIWLAPRPARAIDASAVH